MMSARVAWACALSVLLHVGFIVLWRVSGTGTPNHFTRITASEPHAQPIHARLLPPPTVAAPPPVAVVMPRPSVAYPSREEAREPTFSGATAQIGKPGHGDTPTTQQVQHQEAQGGESSEQGPNARASKPLSLELNKGWAREAEHVHLPVAPGAAGKLNRSRRDGGLVTIQESISNVGERRAKVSTPRGSYCMRSRRSAGSHDPRLDRGMVATTCPEGE